MIIELRGSGDGGGYKIDRQAEGNVKKKRNRFSA